MTLKMHELEKSRLDLMVCFLQCYLTTVIIVHSLKSLCLCLYLCTMHMFFVDDTHTLYIHSIFFERFKGVN